MARSLAGCKDNYGTRIVDGKLVMTQSTPRSRINSAVRKASLPVFLLRGGLQIDLFNRGCEELTGWSATEMIGMKCKFHSDEDPVSKQALANALAPPVEIWGKQLTSLLVPSFIPHRDGKSLTRNLHFFPLKDEQNEVRFVLGIILEMERSQSNKPETTALQFHAELGAARMALRQQYQLTSLIASSMPMQRVLQQFQLATTSEVPLVLQGEPGTGKEHIARILHFATDKPQRSFVPLDCKKTLWEELENTVERLLELPQEETVPKKGLQPRTVYFSHLGFLPRDLQKRLVEAFRKEKSPQWRFVASTEEPLNQLLHEERLIPEFYFMLSSLVMEIPPLRDREEDLPLLAQYLLERANPWDEKQMTGFSAEVLQIFQEYQWPGNIDELISVITEARELCSGSIIETDHFPFRFRTALDAQQMGPVPKPLPLKPLQELLDEVERSHIEFALEVCQYNKKKAADLLGITRPRIYRRMESLGIRDKEEQQRKE